MSAGARAVVDRYERSLSAEARRRSGAHYTPAALADLVTAEACAALGTVPRTVCDPACGAGSFLLAAADWLLSRGVPAREVVEDRLVGADLDPEAAAAARIALTRWAEDHGVRDPEPRPIVVGDALLSPPEWWPGRPPAGFDLVVGNPPFLTPLATRNGRDAAHRRRIDVRFGISAGYADTAALFLLGALDLVRPGGVVALVQPQSFLAARDAGPIRDAVLGRSAPVALWGSDEHLFDAAVRVCVPVLRLRDPAAPAAASDVRVLWDMEPRELSAVPLHAGGAAGGSWGHLLAQAHGIPSVAVHSSGRVGDLATATAGFRDEYYALRDAAVDDGGGHGAPSPGVRAHSERDETAPRLATVGMVEPGWDDWGRRAVRFGGRRVHAPRVDPAALAERSPRVARWAAARRVPKVLVATQTRVVEAAPDVRGTLVPVTPLISVEPADPGSVLALTAALLSPTVSAAALAGHLGLGLAARTLRWSASAVLEVELPGDAAAWARGAQTCAELADARPEDRGALLDRLGATMAEAYGVGPDHDVVAWWRARVGRR